MSKALDEIAARAKALHKDIGADETAYLTAAIEMLTARVKLAEDALMRFLNIESPAGLTHARAWLAGIEVKSEETLTAARKLEEDFREKHK